MNAKVLLLLILPFAASAQGFAGLGTAADDFAVPQPGYVFSFPDDHGAHPDFRIEWWYLTANLRDERGVDYGLQWTLFRSALAPQTEGGWTDPQVWMGHAAVTTPDRHYVAERLARGGVDQAGVTSRPFEAWIDDWALSGDWSAMEMSASGTDFSYRMNLTAAGPLVFHGDDGFSVKSAQGQASYYYSQPFFEIAGTLTLPDGDVDVAGTAWLDREWSSQPLSEYQTGWDWFSLNLDAGEKLMGFRLRQSDGSVYTSATWIEPDGSTTTFADGAFEAVPLETVEVADRNIPTRWRMTLDARDVAVEVEAINDAAWMATSVPYWEGPVIISGSHEGRGYLEMTGYE